MKGSALYTVILFVSFMPLMARCQTGLKAHVSQKIVVNKKEKKKKHHGTFDKHHGTFNIVDQEQTEPVGSVTIEVYSNGTLISSSSTGADGYSGIINLPPGRFDIKALKAGYDTVSLNGVLIASREISYVEIEMNPVSVKKSK